MSQHRLALVGILLAIVATFAATAAYAAGQPANVTDPVALRALHDEGTYQGECWQWMKKVVADATGRTVGFDYRQGFFEAGAVEVSLANARAGDVIQIADDAYTAPDADYAGLHTLIVLKNNGDGTVDGIDSNSQWDGIVRQRTAYDPGAKAATYGLDFHVYRFTASAGAAPAGAAAPRSGPLAKGDKVIVRSGGDGLNLRPEPSTTKAAFAVLRDGMVLTVVADLVQAEGRSWAKVSTPMGTGWVAAEYLERDTGSGAGSSGSGSTQQLRPYRNVIPLVATGN